MVQEGIGFAQDSEVGGGDDYLFISVLEDFSEANDDGIFIPDFENPGAACAPFTVAPQSVGSFTVNTEEEQMDGDEEQRVVVVDEHMYYVAMNIGNLPKPYFLDVDTGSDLTWLQCDTPCISCNKIVSNLGAGVSSRPIVGSWRYFGPKFLA
ncbi:hypothetical protein BAE44_0016097 [Dichanthelium oligosanthes]|uniref:Peptidase A1 domain-containing protein n=1 Tax=Dichanthelium oligosanthes TaxID=888268 RepID=A0A1E5VCZ9_9POAL|nr:hypothetical protein BAE44_0016097 [Dichanthelium oligosanthes]